MLEINLFQWWVILGLILATVDWSMPVQLIRLIVKPLTKNKHRMQWQWAELLMWPIRAGGFFAVAMIYSYKNYAQVGLFILGAAGINLVINLVRHRAIFFDENQERKQSEQIGIRKALGMALSVVMLIAFAYFTMGYGVESGLRAEIAAVRALCSNEQKDGELCQKYVLPESVVKVERNGTTWWEIHASFDTRRVYEIIESPGHNRMFASWQRNPLVVRTDLLIVQWRKGEADSMPNATAARIVSDSFEEPERITLTSVSVL